MLVQIVRSTLAWSVCMRCPRIQDQVRWRTAEAWRSSLSTAVLQSHSCTDESMYGRPTCGGRIKPKTPPTLLLHAGQGQSLDLECGCVMQTLSVVVRAWQSP
eukprot:356225-Chlamydomonas_euryale.AAC.3